MNTLFPGWANLKRVPRVRWSLPNHFIQVKVSGQPSSFGTDRKVSLYHLHTASLLSKGLHSYFTGTRDGPHLIARRTFQPQARRHILRVKTLVQAEATLSSAFPP